ncbi:MAG: PilC/PilY family type IV pilus protein [Desulfuromonadales bacterium]|nr:PilC/PilY family type IV pilus protein [Desulfuromonadales bacterium]
MRTLPGIFLLGALLSHGLGVVPTAMAQPEMFWEFFTSTPVADRDLLVIASADATGRQGHLRGYALDNPGGGPLWDAAQRMPHPGLGTSPGAEPAGDPPARPDLANVVRTLYTNLPDAPGRQALLPLALPALAELQPAIGVADESTAAALIHLARGRIGCTAENPTGLGDAPTLLWGIRRARPLLLGHNPIAAATRERDRIAYVGAEDGMLHAFYTGAWDDTRQGYPLDDADAGRELWAYLPGSLLASLPQQPFAAADRPSLLAVDGSPTGGEFYLDLDGDGRARWHTLLAATATDRGRQRSSLFVLDVTDPYQPRLLWEQILPTAAAGMTRGVRIGLRGPAHQRRPTLYLSAAVTLVEGGESRPALQFQAIDLQRGRLLWQSTLPYPDASPAFATPPPVPTLLDSDGDALIDVLISGDLAGRLWAIRASDGTVIGDGPLLVTAGGSAEPIGAEATLHGRVIYIGTGGSEFADPHAYYAIYAVVFTETGGQLLWRLPLAPGEQVWQAPLVDRSGNLLLGVSIDYFGEQTATATATRGRLLAIRRDGALAGASEQPAGLIGQPLVRDGLVMAVSLHGAVSQYGSAATGVSTTPQVGTVRILSWRFY